MSSNFDEKSGTVECKTDWGLWYQTAEEIVVEVQVPEGTRGKEVSVKISHNHVSCKLKDKVYFDGDLFEFVDTEESVWSLEDRKLVRILLAKAKKTNGTCWKSLFLDGSCAPDEWTFDQMQRKFTLEKYQVQNPGFDFSSASISGNYENGGYI
ncbi:nudC domain-containing protein 2-like [Ciona intestinalis]